MKQFGFGDYFSDTEKPSGLWMTEPLGYLDFLHLNMNALMVITDSGGLQEETTVLGVPCITLRNNTERPVTCEMGTNFVVGNSRDDILRYIVLPIENYTFNRMVNHKFMIYKDKYQFSLSHV
jgi:UDP-N-acetylglucosamine 2-epimerase (non-hydrolysing)